MKITGVKTYIMESPGREYVFIKISTDEGIHGWGEGTLEMKQGTVAAAVGDLEPFLLGEDPTRVDHLWQRMYRQGFWRGGVAILSALSAIEQALWDITGKAYGQPVYKLLGGAVRDYIPCYTHNGNPERAQQLMEEGWRAFKFGPPGGRGGNLTVDERELIRASARNFERMRTACGEDVELMCDVHGRLRPSVAVRLGKALEPYGLFFFEEAVPPDNIKDLRLVRDAGLSMDLATGERAFTKWGYRELLERQLVDVVQPDVCHAGGILELRKIAALAETHYVKVAPHNPNGPVATAASLHVAASIPNFLILELAQSEPHRALVQREGLTVEGGWIALPRRPGLGVKLDQDVIAAHPYRPHDYPGAYYADGAVADI